jgi:hypothetical protein
MMYTVKKRNVMLFISSFFQPFVFIYIVDIIIMLLQNKSSPVMLQASNETKLNLLFTVILCNDHSIHYPFQTSVYPL